MEHPQHQISIEELLRHFPHEKPRENQMTAMEHIAANCRSIHEMPTGEGKTDLGNDWLLAWYEKGVKPLYYATLNKNLVSQAAQMHPSPEDVITAWGRNEYRCCYYKKIAVTAEEAPCSLLKDCPHRVNLETGETKESGAEPCPYLQAKYLANQGKIVICTHAFLITNLLYNKGFTAPEALVLDETHELAKSARNVLGQSISDASLKRAIKALTKIEQQNDLKRFLETMLNIAKFKPIFPQFILGDHEIKKLIGALEQIDKYEIEKTAEEAIRKGILDAEKDMAVLKTIEKITRHIPWYIKNLYYSISVKGRRPENYAYFYYEKANGDNEEKCKLYIKHFYVSPLLRNLLGKIPLSMAYSAYIGNAEVFNMETGIDYPFYTYPSSFPIANTRIFLPTDTPNLAQKSALKNDKTKALKMIAGACRDYLDENHRSMVIVCSDKERESFVKKFKGELEIMSYGDGIKPREAVDLFKSGQGDVLIGTSANYSTGIDLPNQTAPAIFFLRPSYPSPYDPQAQFEEKRWGAKRWVLWNYRASLEALQTRGRNVRSMQDMGMCFFVSQQFGRILKSNLPAHLEEAKREKPFAECVDEGLKLLRQK